MTVASVAAESCESCTTIARSLRPGERWECPYCGETDRRAPARERRETLPAHRDGWLALLRDCRLIARWDSIASAPAMPLPTPPRRLVAGDCAPTALPGGGSHGGARIESTERPEWQDDSRSLLFVGSALRRRLDRIWSLGRTGDVTAHRAAGVIEWLVPRARVLLDGAQQDGTPIQRDLPQLVGWAHVSEAQRAKWLRSGMRADGARRHGVELLDSASEQWRLTRC